MKNILRGLAALSTLTVLLPVVVGCGGSKLIPDFTMPEGGFDTSKPVVINFYHTMGQSLIEVLDAYIGEGSEFNQMYPNIIVKEKSVGNYDDIRDQLTTEISAGANDANISYCYPDHVARYLKGQSVVTLDNLMYDAEYGYSEAQLNDFVPAFLKEGQSFGDGKTYCLPFSKSSRTYRASCYR